MEVNINSVHVTKEGKKMVDSVDKKTNPAHKSPISLKLTYSGLTYEDSETIRSTIVPTMKTWGVVTWATGGLQMWSTPS